MPREHPLAPHRLIPVAVIALLAVVAFLAVRGPDWYQRFYHPLRYESVIAERSSERGLDPYLVAALINVESGFDADDVSPRRAVGLMQLMPETAAEVARDNRIPGDRTPASLKDPDLNIRIGTLHLALLRDRFATTEQALAAYNAGEGNVREWIGKMPKARSNDAFLDSIEFPETRRYVRDVLEQREVYARLYPNAFEGVSK